MSMKISTSIFALSLGILASADARAADMYGNGSMKDGGIAPAEYAARSWTGLWIAAVGGYQISNSTLSNSYSEKEGDPDGIGDTTPLGSTTYSDSASIDGLGQEGAFGELQIGFDKQINNRLVLGVFAGLNLNGGEFSVDASKFVAGNPTKSGSANLLNFNKEWGGVVGPRVGFLTSKDTMFYLAAGYAFGEIGEIESDFGGKDGKGGAVFKDQETDLQGWFGEAGMETRLDGNWYLKVAGRYTDYSAITLDSDKGTFKDSKDTWSEKTELDHNELAAMAGLNYKIGVGLPNLD